MQKKLIKINDELSDTVCPLPFISFYGSAKGNIVACCESQETTLSSANETFIETWNNEKYKKLRLELINGSKPNACKKCWLNEERGIESNRMQSLVDFSHNYYGISEMSCYSDGSTDMLPVFLELKPSNICNLKCKMCHPESSHRVYEDREIISRFRKHLPWDKKPLVADKLLDQIKNNSNDILSSLKILQFSGGEPLISRKQFELIDAIPENLAKNIELRYSTNLNNIKFEEFDTINIWKKFKKINLKVSVDGIDEVYDYVRTGGSFNKLIKNIDHIVERNIKNVTIGFGLTTQKYNIFQLPEFMEYFCKYVSESRITTHLLYTPRLFFIGGFPEEINNKLIKKLKESRFDFKDKIRVLMESKFNEEQWNNFISYTELLENKHKPKFSFKELIDKYL